MEYLFGAHVGPVQPFIADARRTHDLYLGSQLVSEVSKAVARAIKVTCGNMQYLIFPAPDPALLEDLPALDRGSQLNVSNKIIACIPASHTPDEVGQAARVAINALLEELARDAFRRVGDQQPFNREVALEQIKSCFEYYWVAVPYEGADYHTSYKRLEALLTARKNTRDYASVTWGAYTDKSSIDGQMESVIPASLYSKRRIFKHGVEHENENSRTLFRRFRAGPAERLSGIDLLKRRGTIRDNERERNFPSTSHMATIPYLRCLDKLSGARKMRAKELWEDYIDFVPAIGKAEATPEKEQAVVEVLERVKGYRPSSILDDYDGGMLFQERLLQDVVNLPNFAAAQEKLKKFLGYINDCFEPLVRPGSYYAILMADGDNMGKMIDHQTRQDKADGDNTDEMINHQTRQDNGRQRHQKLSRTMSAFARQAEEIVKEHQGAPVYTGGDDVIALLPLHTILQCATALTNAFANGMKSKQFSDEDGRVPTLSVGIAIVHHLDLLQDALETARRAEREAKAMEGKNALAVILSKRSGEDYTITRKWEEKNERLDIDPDLRKLIQACREQLIPGGTAYEIRDSARRLTALDIPLELDVEGSSTAEPEKISLMEVLQADTRRILKRKLFVPHTKSTNTSANTSKEEREAKAHKLLTLFTDHIVTLQRQLGHHNQPAEAARVFEQLVNELIIAQELADAITLSETEPAKELQQ